MDSFRKAGQATTGLRQLMEVGVLSCNSRLPV